MTFFTYFENDPQGVSRPMITNYNRIAGQSLERLAALSDGVFAVAMTILVLDLRTPATQSIHTEHELGQALLKLIPQLIMYMMSFITLGIFWAGQQTQLNHLARGDRNFAWIHIAFLCALSTLPFSTRLLAEFMTYRVALIIYWLNILIPGLILYAGCRYIRRADLAKADLPKNVGAAIERRILIAQTLYALGAALCVVSTYLSIAFIVLVQLNYAVAPGMFHSRSPKSDDSFSPESAG